MAATKILPITAILDFGWDFVFNFLRETFKLISIILVALFYPCGTFIISFFKYIGGGLMRKMIFRRVGGRRGVYRRGVSFL